MTLTIVAILALIEGLTEFLPVSSTGHLIVASGLLGIKDEGFINSFNIIIQAGAILSVLVLYWRRFLPQVEFYKKLIVAFLPAAVIGLLVKSKIDILLSSLYVVAVAWIIGGIILIWSDQYFANRSESKRFDQLSLIDCFKIGLIQCFAFIPGVSRSAASILGGLSFGLSRKEAAEFSFFLAVPTLVGATALKLHGALKTIDDSHIMFLIVGSFLSFVFALIAIQFFIKLVSRFGFRHFGIYRIIIGVITLALIFSGNLTSQI